ncbi:MAG: WecB/TagA/CpsF family glycosyltransferase [Bacteroidales bacterium]|nr:WecB/TagA/CpsF family glycosyltransferase [Bacteroidales bacterium]MDT8375050.1 WecB/TagA/CpsF family glycosyltransferase [Bacteroidales bacterium]
MSQQNTVSVLGYSVYAGSRDYLADGVTGVVATLNPHSYVIARRDRQFREALMAADLLIPDGTGIQLAAKVLQGRKIEKTAGSDLHEVIITALGGRGGSCFYLGSSDATLHQIRERLVREHPGVRVGSFSPPYSEKFTDDENEEMIRAINEFSPDVLFVGMTAPKQEKWVHENRAALNVPLVCPVGAVFDFYAGTVRRSGEFWIKMGLEWLPRLLREPKRLWKRNFISTPLFLVYIVREKIRMTARLNKSGKKIVNN